ncbi:NEK protein kinase [Saprolegnia parasitica CBS 223.65]|uniref:non-specific serine/threonine protein kinase n=1 Tax=Saprolegnia parasitica (strain CBS 223.65) TaxID=695850 RepID=A0A067D907_SAPPC|nr:NEK protein kinase [Saprolegnia parasitica CBS 223.65]KDO35492.1 NEK protein kinase [Saprolegnia parasitica CBS 223.65]|eukprot:XP_012193829.1 NEK protein kinase [Saprolegnia parasitica CBS 223.65]
MDQYDHIRVIGKGSFGVVSKIRRQTDGKELVWKEVGYGQMTEKEKQLIVSEVNILRELRHPHIVRYLDRVIDKQSSKIFIVMEYCEGGDLSQLIKRKRREGSTIEEAFIWQVFTQLYMALKECHRHREGNTVRPILHRDIKPGNIFLDAQNNAKLGDFGLAKELSSESKFAQTNVGTPYYMSPEMVNEMTYDERSDIWALGCLLYEMAALAPPFDATNQLALAKKINAGKFARIPEAYSEDLFQAIKWMLHRQRSRRPRIEDLERIPQLARRLQTYSMTLAEASLHETYTAKMKELIAIEEELRRQEAVLLVRESQVKEAEDDVRRREADVKKRERLVEALSRTYSNSSPNNSSCHSGSSDHSPVCSQCGSSSSPYSVNNNDVHLSLPTPPRKSRSYEATSLKGTPSRHFRFDEYSPTKYTPPPTSRYYPAIESPVRKSLDRYYQQA